MLNCSRNFAKMRFNSLFDADSSIMARIIYVVRAISQGVEVLELANLDRIPKSTIL